MFRSARTVATVSVCMVLASILAAPVADAKPGTPSRLEPQVEKLDDDGGEVHGIASKEPERPQVPLPGPVWPVPGAVAKAGGPVMVERVDAGIRDVAVEVLDRRSVPSVWQDGVLLRVGASERKAAKATISVDYNGFRHAYGAGWSDRLRLWEVPGCALTTPDLPACAAKPLPSRNATAAGRVTGEVRLSGDSGSLVALAAQASGDSGDFAATPLAASATWSAGGSSGDFSWSYDMRVPPGLGGPQPKLTVSYSSSSVDGRSAATNNQPSWLGEGFELGLGYIERKYVACGDDKSGSPNNGSATNDLCWRSDNATMQLNGATTELVWQSGRGWHARSEDAAKIEKLSGGSNGDDNGEHWKVTTADGVQYFFGLNVLPGQSATTDSTWTVPVHGNHSGEPCHATAFADSDCTQAWRWNLDYVVDPHGNTMSYWYAKELNQYAARQNDSDNLQYVRGGYLKRIDYGTWDRGSGNRSVTPMAKTTFDVDDRCLSSCGTHDAAHWPDVPWDQECKTDASACPGKHTPTFWSTKRLAKVTTSVWDTTKPAAAWQDVDSWAFAHSFPSPGDGTNAGLWLASITHTGLVGTPVAMPPVTFEPVAMPNRVLTGSNTTNNWQRIANIVTETGAKIQVGYSLPECTSGNRPAAAHTNTMRCYPVIGPDPLATDGSLLTEWWHKYVVTYVSETDIQLAGGHQAPTKTTNYQYEGTPAWHYADDDGLTKPAYKTWNQFRGYSTVVTKVGDDPARQTLTKTTYLRGMHGDRNTPAGGTRSVTVPASVGTETVYDEDTFAGMAREEVVYNGVESKPVSKTVNVPWQSPATASRTINGDTVTARFADTRTVYSSTALGVDGTSGWRTTRTHSTFDDTYGDVLTVQDDGDVNAPEKKCTTTTYNRNTGLNIVRLPKRVTTTALPCGSNPATVADVISDVRTSYDGASSPDTAPTRGLVSKTEELKDWASPGGTVFQVMSQATYDAFGRQRTSTDVRGNTATVAYTPASGGPVTRTTETSTAPYNWVTTTDLAAYWGSPVKHTDPNGRVSEATYDALGRVAKVWKLGWSRADNPNTPSAEYTYAYSPTRSDYPHIKTKALNAAGGPMTSYQVFDGFLRARQTQAEAVGGGRIVTDTIHDAWGRPTATYRAHAEPGSPSGALWWEPEWSLPSVDRTDYDRAGRATAEVFLSGDGVTNLVEKWRTTKQYTGDSTMVTPPKGGVATTTVTDVQGRTVQLRQHTTPAGVAGPYTTTSYTFNNKGQQTKVTDTLGNEWSFTYDTKGRQISAQDPDKGKTSTKFNDFGDTIETTDANNKVLAFQYDQLGRKTGLYDTMVSPTTRRAEWRYDTTVGGDVVRGQLTHKIRYDNGNAYEEIVSNFTARYQPTAVVYLIPASETGLTGSYTVANNYSAYDDTLTGMTYPAAAGWGSEQVTTVHDTASGLPVRLNTTMPGVGTYVVGQQYTSQGEPTITTLETSGGVYVEDAKYYDTATRQVTRRAVKSETATGPASDRTYAFDGAGNIKSIVDAPYADNQCFRYDDLQRLRSAWTPRSGVSCDTAPATATLGGPAQYWLDWEIDNVGNRTEEVSRAAAGDTKRKYTTPASGVTAVRPHAVTGVTTEVPGTAPSTQNYSYDDAGNMKTRPGQTLAWNPEGKLSSVTQGSATTSHVYDVEGTRFIRRDATGKTLYLPGMELRYDNASKTQSLVRYYSFNGTVIASRSTAGGLVWLHADHQGTHQVSVNAQTQAVTIRRQTPYGTPRGAVPAWPNSKSFVGGDEDPTGLVHIGAREYDAGLGRFISVDPIHDLTDPQQWNAYSYTTSNPMTFADPTGEKQCGDDRCTTYSVPTSDGGEMIHEPGGKRTKIRNGKSKVVSTGKRPVRRPPPPESCTQSTPEYCHPAGAKGDPYSTVLGWLATVTYNQSMTPFCMPHPDALCAVTANFRGGDELTEQLKQWRVFAGIEKEVSRLAAGGKMFGYHDYHYDDMGLVKAGMNLFMDLLGGATGGKAGNDPISVLTGSFDLDWQVVGYENDRPVVEYHVQNASTLNSITPRIPNVWQLSEGDGKAGNGSDGMRYERIMIQSYRFRITA